MTIRHHRPDRSHHHPRVKGVKVGKWFWMVTCPCGMREVLGTWHAATVVALHHSQRIAA